MGDVAVRFYTIEHFPVREYLGAVTFWARDADLATAEDQAFAGLAERATAMGGDTVVGLRVETERELTIRSEQARCRISGRGSAKPSPVENTLSACASRPTRRSRSDRI